MADLLTSISEVFASKAAIDFTQALWGGLLWLALLVVILIVFWFISTIIKKIVIKATQSLGIDAWVEEHKISSAIGNRKITEVLGSLAKWYFILIGLTIATETPAMFTGVNPIAGINEFLLTIVYYVPRALGGVLFFILALLFAKYLANQILAMEHKLKNIAASIVEGLIIIFAGIVTLQMVLGTDIAQTILQLIQIFISPFIISLAIVFGIVAGLTAGLGFKEELQKFAKDMKREYWK